MDSLHFWHCFIKEKIKLRFSSLKVFTLSHHCSFSNPVKTSKNLPFSELFMVNRNGRLVWNELSFFSSYVLCVLNFCLFVWQKEKSAVKWVKLFFKLCFMCSKLLSVCLTKRKISTVYFSFDYAWKCFI